MVLAKRGIFLGLLIDCYLKDEFENFHLEDALLAEEHEAVLPNEEHRTELPVGELQEAMPIEEE